MKINYPCYAELTADTLKDLHNSIRKCLAADDANPSSEKVYGVRTFADWKNAKDAIEAELMRHNISYDKITI